MVYDNPDITEYDVILYITQPFQGTNMPVHPLLWSYWWSPPGRPRSTPVFQTRGGVPNMGPRSVNGEIFTFAARNGELFFAFPCWMSISWNSLMENTKAVGKVLLVKPSNPSKCKSSAFVGLHTEFHEVNSQDAFGSFWNVEASMRIVYVYWLEYWLILHLQKKKRYKNNSTLQGTSPYPTWGKKIINSKVPFCGEVLRRVNQSELVVCLNDVLFLNQL